MSLTPFIQPHHARTHQPNAKLPIMTNTQHLILYSFTLFSALLMIDSTMGVLQPSSPTDSNEEGGIILDTTTTTSRSSIRALKVAKKVPKGSKGPKASSTASKTSKALKNNKAPKSTKKASKKNKSSPSIPSLSPSTTTSTTSASNSPSSCHAIVQVGNALRSDFGYSDRFGYSVSLSKDGRRIAVGGPPLSGSKSYLYIGGSVKIFDYNPSQQKWVPIGNTLLEYESSSGDAFGTTVSLSDDGNVLAITSPGDDHQHGSNAGYARVYTYFNGNWIQLGTDILGLTAGDRLERAVLSGDGNYLAVSMPGNDDNGNESGKVQVYTYINHDEEWTQIGNDIDGMNTNDLLGIHALALSFTGKTFAVGSCNEQSPYQYVHVYTLMNDDSWRILGGGMEFNDNSCIASAALSDDGRRLVIGKRTNTGLVEVYDFDELNHSWTSVGNILIGENDGDFFGDSVSISGVGNRIAIGAPKHNGNGEEDAGHVRVYDYDVGNDRWVQIDQDINGDRSYDLSGSSVSLSKDGTHLAAGAPAGTFEYYGYRWGSARVYQLKGLDECEG